jgi:hypothetical protein
VPLYPPAVVYQQLMYDPKSRINACTWEGHYRDNYRCVCLSLCADAQST